MNPKLPKLKHPKPSVSLTPASKKIPSNKRRFHYRNNSLQLAIQEKAKTVLSSFPPSPDSFTSRKGIIFSRLLQQNIDYQYKKRDKDYWNLSRLRKVSPKPKVYLKPISSKSEFSIQGTSQFQSQQTPKLPSEIPLIPLQDLLQNLIQCKKKHYSKLLSDAVPKVQRDEPNQRWRWKGRIQIDNQGRTESFSQRKVILNKLNYHAIVPTVDSPLSTIETPMLPKSSN